MARHNPERTGIRPATPIAGARYQCAACPALVSQWVRFCRSDWNKLQSAPDGLRDRLAVPAGENAHDWAGPGYRLAVERAREYLAKVRGAR